MSALKSQAMQVGEVNERNTIHVAFCVDKAYLPGLAVAMRSLAENCARDLVLHIVHHAELDEVDLENLHCVAPFERVRVETYEFRLKRFDELPEDGQEIRHASIATYFRLALAFILPSNVTRVIYLDSDVVVVGDVSELWEVNLNGLPFGAVHDLGIPSFGSDAGFADAEELGLPLDTDYFNAGVLVIDLPAWKEQRVSQRAAEYLERVGDRNQLLDQEALNYVAVGDFFHLPQIWNVLNFGKWPELPQDQAMKLANEAKLHHFAGSWLPWKGEYPYEEGSRLFFRYLQKTPFAHDFVSVPVTRSEF